MNYKSLYITSLIIMIIGVLCIGINCFISTLPTAVIRIAGIFMLAGLFVLGYSIAKSKSDNK